MVAHRGVAVETVTALFHSPPVMYIAGAMALAAGLAIVLGHNVWSGGVRPVMVTLIGWLALIKGLIFLFLSPGAAESLIVGIHYGQLFYLYAAISLILGAYLTYGGFRSASS